MSKKKEPPFWEMPSLTRKWPGQCRLPRCEARGVRWVGASLLCEDQARHAERRPF